MRLTRLKLRNFLSHRETEVEFPETGITLISGENAMGKSSLFDALRFALFGKSFQRAGDLVTRGEKSLGVEAEFTHRGHKYRVIREYAATKKELKPTKAELWKDDRPAAAGGISDLNPLIVRELGMNHEMFRYSVMAVQGEIMGVLGLSPSDRRVVFERMFGYHHLQLVAEAASSLASEKEKELGLILKTTGRASPEELERDIEERKNALAEKVGLLSGVIADKKNLLAEEESLSREARELETQESELNEQEKERAALEREIRVMEDEIDRLEEQKLENEEKLRNLPHLKETLKTLEGELAELFALRAEAEVLTAVEKKGVEATETAKRLDEARGYEKALRELLPAHERFKRLKEEEEALMAEIENLNVRLGANEELRKTLSVKQKEKEQLEQRLGAFSGITESRERIRSRIEEKEVAAKGVEAERGGAEGRIKGLQKDIKELKGLGDTCPLCKQKLTPEHKSDVLRQLEEELAEAKRQAEELYGRSRAIAEELSALKKLEKSAEEKEKIEDLLSRCLAEMGETQKRLDEAPEIGEKHKALKKNLEMVRDELRGLEPAERKFSLAAEFIARNPPERLGAALADIQREMEDLKGKRRFPGMGLDEVKSRIKELSETERRYGKLDAEIKNLERLGLEVEKQARLLEEKRATLAEKGARLNSLVGLETKRAMLEERKKSHSDARENLRARKEALSEKEINLRRDIQAIESEMSSLSSSLESIKRTGEKMAVFAEIKDKLLSPQGIEREFMTTMRRLEDNLNACFQDFSFSDLQAVRLDEDLVPVKVDEMGREMERLSGGEQVAMGIAMRFAIARALLGGESESLFLDEPTHNLDFERISSLQNLLAEFKMHSTAPQVVIITHDEDMKVIADTVIEVVKEGGISRVLSGGELSQSKLIG